MKKEEAKYYAEKYRRTQKKISIGLFIFILIVGVILLTTSVLIFIYSRDSEDRLMLYIVAGILLVVAAADTGIAFKFMKYSKKHYLYMNDYECAEHYCRIHGFDRVNPPAIPKNEEKK